jgi:hypothetical protein
MANIKQLADKLAHYRRTRNNDFVEGVEAGIREAYGDATLDLVWAQEQRTAWEEWEPAHA